MKRLSKRLYLWPVIGGTIAGIILLVIFLIALLYFLVLAGALPDHFQNLRGVGMEALAIGISLAFLCFAAEIFGLIMGYILIYRAWEAIQDGHARTTPGKAVGFLFIPFFNLYWVFVAWYGFAQDYNSYIERHAVTASKLNKGLYLTYCILGICSAIPYLGYLALIPIMVIFIIMVNATINAVNALPVGLPVEN